MGSCFFALGFICYFIGVIVLITSNRRNPAQQPVVSSNRPAAVSSDFVSNPVPTREAKMSQPQALSQIQIGERIRVVHPLQGELTLYVMGADNLSGTMAAKSPGILGSNRQFIFWFLARNR